MCIFGLEFENIIVIFQISVLEFLLLQSLVQKQKSLISDQKCLVWVFLGKNLKKNYCHIGNQHPQIWLFAKFHEKTKMLKFGNKNAWFGYFWARILENYCHVLNQHLRICVIPKFCEETKMLRFGTKNAFFEYFWPKNLYLVIFGLEFKKKNYCHIWNQHPWICVIAKHREITKMPKFGTKSALFGYFWAGIWKKLLSYLKSAPSNLSKMSL